jgi:RNA 2',3'-cyclic 3'-phosphodiesterase
VPPRNPRLFALDLDDEDGRAAALQARLAAALEAAHVYRPERRPFWPHLTLARVKRNERRVPGLTPAPAPDDLIVAGELTLYRSTLRPQGALYEPLARHRLGAVP